MHPATIASFLNEIEKIGGFSLLGTPVSQGQMQKMVDWHSKTPLHQVVGSTAKKIHNEISNKWSAHPMFSRMGAVKAASVKKAGLSDMGGFTGRAGVLTGDISKSPLRSAANIRGKPSIGSGGLLQTQPRPKMPKAVSSIVPKAPSTLAPKVAPKAGGLLGGIKTLFR